MRLLIVWAVMMAGLMVACPNKVDATDSDSRIGDGWSQMRRSKPMLCQEDEALVWVDAPYEAECVNMEDI